MADLPKLMLKPFRNGYGFNLGYGVVSTDTEYGMPRQRLDGIGKPHKLTATYKCTRAMYQYLVAFLRVYKGLPFNAYLLLDDVDHTWYECRITASESIQVSTLGDQIFTVQLPMVVKPIKYSVDTDKSIIAIYEMTGGKPNEFYNYLEKLVNQDLPKAMLKTESINTQIDYSVPDLIKSLDTFDYVSMSGGNQQVSGDNFKSLTNTDLPSAMTGAENISD